MICLSVLCSHAQYSPKIMGLSEKARNGDGNAEFELAMIYLDGTEVTRHYFMTTHWLAQAFYDGQKERVRTFYHSLTTIDSKHLYYGYMCYMRGMVYLLEEHNPNLAAFWFSRSAGYDRIPEAEAMYYISFASFMKTVPGAEEKVKELVNRGRETAEKDPFLLTLEQIDTCKKGDTLKVVTQWKKCAEAGIPLADSHLGRIYLLGKGQYYDAAKAVKHFEIADRMKMLEEHNLYALCYHHGLGGLSKDSLSARIIEKREHEPSRSSELLEYIHKEDLLKTAPIK